MIISCPPYSIHTHVLSQPKNKRTESMFVLFLLWLQWMCRWRPLKFQAQTANCQCQNGSLSYPPTNVS